MIRVRIMPTEPEIVLAGVVVDIFSARFMALAAAFNAEIAPSPLGWFGLGLHGLNSR